MHKGEMLTLSLVELIHKNLRKHLRKLVTVSYNHLQQNSPAAKASTIYAASFEIQTLLALSTTMSSPPF